MNRLDIEQCNDIDALKDLAIRQYKALSYISETLVDESKWHITSDKGIEDIRAYLQKHNLEFSNNAHLRGLIRKMIHFANLVRYVFGNIPDEKVNAIVYDLAARRLLF